jgi:hypothetical protein
MNRHKKLMQWPIIVLVLIGVALTACKKDSEYYDYENNVKEFNGTVMQYLQAQPANTFDSLLLVLNRLPELKDTLSTKSITLFAPTNASFQAAIKNLNIVRKDQGKAPLYLKDCNPIALHILTCRYIIRGSKTTETYAPFADGVVYPSVAWGYPMHIQYDRLNASGFVMGGPQSVIFSDPKNNIFEKYWERSNTNAVNIKAKNGVINILAPLHDYGFNEFISLVNQ